MQHAVAAAVVLHEHQVPDFDVAVAILIRRTRRTTGNILAVVVEDFGAGTARSGIAHRPEIVFRADTAEAIWIDTDFLEPDVGGLFVFFKHGHPELFGGQTDFDGEELPRELDRLALEVITETEVTEHFEKGVVARGITNVFQVIVLATGAHATLAAGCARITAFFTTEKHILELHHAGIREQQCRVIARHK